MPSHVKYYLFTKDDFDMPFLFYGNYVLKYVHKIYTQQ